MYSKLQILAGLGSAVFKILSVSNNLVPLGVNDPTTSPQPVHINGPVQIWTATVDGNKLRVAIDGFLYTGVDQSGLVIASNNTSDDVLWDVWPHQDKLAFSVTQADKPYLAWTVLEDGQIGVQNLVIEPDVINTQLFQYQQNV